MSADSEPEPGAAMPPEGENGACTAMLAEGDDGSAGVPTEAYTWSMAQARHISRSQTGASNCGATALLNVCAALGVPVPDVGAADEAVKTNSRRHGVPLSEYLAARSVAGTTAEDIVAGCSEVTSDSLEARFFAFDPPRDVDLQTWLAGWLSRGCSAVATLNTQRMYGADYWHHQMIFGVSASGVAVTNGIEVLGMAEIMTGLESPSVLQIRASDVLRCKPYDAAACDALGPSWAKLKVTEQAAGLKTGENQASFVFIPAAYRAGITVFAVRDSEAAASLLAAPELPLRADEE